MYARSRSATSGSPISAASFSRQSSPESNREARGHLRGQRRLVATLQIAQKTTLTGATYARWSEYG